MSRAKKDSQALNMNLEKGLHDRLLAYCKLSGLTKTATIERALQMYLNDCERKQSIIEQYDKKDIGIAVFSVWYGDGIKKVFGF